MKMESLAICTALVQMGKVQEKKKSCDKIEEKGKKVTKKRQWTQNHKGIW